MTARIELWTDWACNSGRKLGTLRVVRDTFSEQLDNTDALAATIEHDARVVVELRTVARVIARNGSVYEYRIQSRTRTLANGQRTIKAVGPLYDLANAGLARSVSGVATYSYTLSGTPSALIGSVVTTNLAEDGLSWLSVGTITPTASVSYTVPATGWTRLQHLQEIARQCVGYELRLRRNGETGYYIDLRAVGSSAATVRVATGKNLLSADDELNDGQLATAITLFGSSAAGYGPPDTLAENAWTVGTIPGSGPYWIPLSDPAGGDAPVAFASQFGTASGSQGAYLLLADGTTTRQITDSRITPDSAVCVASSAGLTAGDRVQIVADSSANRLGELRTPNVSRLHRVDTNTNLRGERNLCPNPGMATWSSSSTPTGWGTTNGRRYPSTTPASMVLTVTSTVGNTTAVPVNGAANALIFVNDRFDIAGSTSGTVQALGFVQLDGSGNGTLSLAYSGGGTSPGLVSGDTLTVSTNYSTRLQTWPGTTTDYLRIDGGSYTADTPTFLVKPVGSLIIINMAVACAQVVGVSRFAGGGFPVSSLMNLTLYNVDTSSNMGTATTPSTLSSNSLLTNVLLASGSSGVDVNVKGIIGSAAAVDVGSFVRWVFVWLARSTPSIANAPPYRDGAWGNEIWQASNDALLARGLGTRLLRVSWRDLSALAGFDPARETPTLGGNVNLVDLNLTVRVLGIGYSTTSDEIDVMLDARPTRLVKYLVGAV